MGCVRSACSWWPEKDTVVRNGRWQRGHSFHERGARPGPISVAAAELLCAESSAAAAEARLSANRELVQVWLAGDGGAGLSCRDDHSELVQAWISGSGGRSLSCRSLSWVVEYATARTSYRPSSLAASRNSSGAVDLVASSNGRPGDDVLVRNLLRSSPQQ